MCVRRLIGLAAFLGIAGGVATAATAAGLNDRNRLEDGSLGLPLDSMFKEKPPSLPYKSTGEPGESSFLPPLIKSTPEPPRRKAEEPEARLGSALGGRRQN
jgi:hypothetical protein